MGVYWDENLRFFDEKPPFNPLRRRFFKLTSTELSISDLSKLFSREVVFAPWVWKPKHKANNHRYGIDVNRDLIILG